MTVPGPAAESVLLSVCDHVATVTLNRPERRNAMDRATQRLLTQAMSRLAEDASIRVVVITGAGDHAFCAGVDLKELDAAGHAGERLTTPMTGEYRNVFEAVLETGKPTIAAINGFALAGGLELALACDLRISSDTAEFGMPEATIGMGGNFASVLLPRIVPRAFALEMLYTGARIDALRALELGLVNRIYPMPELRRRVDELATLIASNAPLSTRRYKEMALKGWELPIASALRLNVGPNPYDSRDRAEGVRAFIEKRAPRFEGR